MAGQRMRMEEIAVYTVADGKVSREEFFYDMTGASMDGEAPKSSKKKAARKKVATKAKAKKPAPKAKPKPKASSSDSGHSQLAVVKNKNALKVNAFLF